NNAKTSNSGIEMGNHTQHVGTRPSQRGKQRFYDSIISAAAEFLIVGRQRPVIRVAGQPVRLMLITLLHEVFSGLAAREVTRSHRLFAREKLDRIPSVNVHVTKEGILPSRKWEVGRGSGHANVYPYHADFDSTRVLANCCPVFGEYRCAVAARIAIH